MSAFSIHNSGLTLEGIRKGYENQYFERKGRDTKASKLANQVIGMLNASGGVIAFGFSDSGEVEDLNQLAPEKLDAYRKLINDFIHPPANVLLVETVMLFVVEVPDMPVGHVHVYEVAPVTAPTE